MEKMNIKGTAIVEGISRNKVKYTAEELHKFAPTLKGRPILKDHANVTDGAIGKITNSISIDNGKKVMYEGWIKEDGTGIVEKIKDGRISEVSIGAMAGRMIKEHEDDEHVIAKEMVALELSTTPCPGVVGTGISKSEKTTENISDKEVEDLINKFEEMDKEMMKCPECENMIKKMDMKKHMDEKHPDMKKDKNMKDHISHSTEIKNSVPEKEVLEDTNQNVIKGGKMESNEVKVVETAKVDESIALKEELAKSNKLIEAMKEEQRQSAIASYNEKAKAKNLSAQDCSKLTLETIKALTEMVNSIKVEEKKEVIAKEIAQPKSVEVKEEIKASASFNNYVCESSELGGVAFYKSY